MEETKAFFVLYRNGQANVVEQETWEYDWLRWWKSVQAKARNSGENTKKK